MKKVRIELDYDIGDMIYLITDQDQLLRIITEIRMGPTGVMYMVSCGQESSEHYSIELSSDPKI